MIRKWSILPLLEILSIARMCAAAESIAPKAGWRCVPTEIHASDDEAGLKPLLEGRDAKWSPSVTSPMVSFTFRFRSDRPPGPVMLTYSLADPQPNAWVDVSLAEHNKRAFDEIVIAGRQPKALFEKVIFETLPGQEYKFNIWWPNGVGAPTRIHVTDLGLYDLAGTERKDYWLVVGASIEAQSIRHALFKKLACERFSKADPVVFNLGVGGWKTQDLRAALPRFLSEHRYASYVAIHIGGNNVTPNRPYPGDADRIRDDITAILEMVRNAGKIPILARLTYRAYKGDKPVPPESNGSGPYVTNIYDPLIQKYCPLFYDAALGRGRVDGYEWFKAHPDELTPDGVHLNDKGKLNWNRLWVEEAGEVIYGKPPASSTAPGE